MTDYNSKIEKVEYRNSSSQPNYSNQGTQMYAEAFESFFEGSRNYSKVSSSSLIPIGPPLRNEIDLNAKWGNFH